MNFKIWKFLLIFYNYEHILSFTISKGKLEFSRKIYCFNRIFPIIIILFGSQIALRMNEWRLARDEAFKIKDASVLYTRILRFFPSVSLISFALYNSNIKLENQKKILIFGRKLITMIKLLKIDLNNREFAFFERFSLTVVIVTIFLNILGQAIMTYHLMNFKVLSYIAMMIITWFIFFGYHINMICTIFLGLIVLSLETVEKRLQQKKITSIQCINELNLIGEIINEFNLIFGSQMSWSVIRLLSDTVVRVKN